MRQMNFCEELAKLTPRLRDNRPGKIYVFGAGQQWKDIYQWYREVVNVDLLDSVRAFVDNDPKKQGSTHMGLPVISPSEIDMENAVVLFATAAYQYELDDQCKHMGLVYNSGYFYPSIFEQILKRFVYRENEAYCGVEHEPLDFETMKNQQNALSIFKQREAKNKKMREKEIYNFLRKEHFHHCADTAKQKILFKSSIQMVEIEVFSFCNRQCSFCPNSIIDRHSKNHFMDEKLYKKIINDLTKIEYHHMISYSRYNEPLADKVILDRIAYAREKLPRARLHTITNGDYLTPEYIEELAKAGLNSLNIQAYIDRRPYSQELAVNRITQKVEKMDLDYYWVAKGDDYNEAVCEYDKMAIRIYSKNFRIHGCDRGGLLDLCPGARVSPCLLPAMYFYVDYNGKCTPCCNIRSDAAAQLPYVLGDASADSIFTIYASEKAAAFRKTLLNFKKKKGVCAQCRMSLHEDGLDERYRLFRAKLRMTVDRLRRK